MGMAFFVLRERAGGLLMRKEGEEPKGGHKASYSRPFQAPKHLPILHHEIAIDPFANGCRRNMFFIRLHQALLRRSHTRG